MQRVLCTFCNCLQVQAQLTGASFHRGMVLHSNEDPMQRRTFNMVQKLLSPALVVISFT